MFLCTYNSIAYLQMILTAEYLEMLKQKAILENTKIYFGNRIPDMFMEPSTFSHTVTSKDSSKSQKVRL